VNKVIVLSAALLLSACATVQANPYGPPEKQVQEVVVYLHDDDGRTAAGVGAVISEHTLLGCFAHITALPVVTCYRLTGEHGADENIKLTAPVKLRLLTEGKGS
jgi:hypothetical protein